MKTTFLFSIMLVLNALPVWSAETDDSIIDSTYLAQIDSLMAEEQKLNVARNMVDKYNELKLQEEMKMHWDGMQTLFRGFVLSSTEHDFYKIPAEFKHRGKKADFADYAFALSPLAVNYMMKIADVESRSTWKRMVTANAISMAMTFGTTSALKNGIKENRPDNFNDKSFCSGHSAFAFASATILSREYGHISPWITVGSYGVATGSQMLRIGHNSHWINDLFIGAGVGMMCTNIGYFLTDKLYGSKEINKPHLSQADIMRVIRFNDNPSGLSFLSGTEAGSRTVNANNIITDADLSLLDESGSITLKQSAAFTTGVEASWFVNTNFAIEGIARVSRARTKVEAAFAGREKITFGGNLTDIYHLNLAAKMSTPVGLANRMGVRLIAGMRTIDGAECKVLGAAGANALNLHRGMKFCVPNETKLEAGCGINMEMIEKSNYAAGFTFDYYHTFSHVMANRFSVCTTWKVLF